MRHWLVILAFLCGLVGPAILMAQAPPPVPALPDLERRTEYTITGSNCNCPVGFSLYGDATDFGNWIQVYVNGVLQDASTYAITSPSGSLATLPRPINDAVLNFNALTTGEVQIVGGRRPRRVHQFAENRGVAARDLNQLGNDIEAQNRETWDLRNRTILARPGDAFGPMPAPSTCASAFLTFDSTGLNPTCTQISSTSFTTIPPAFVDNSMLANMPPLTIKCNPTGVDATPTDCISTQSTPLLDTFTVSNKGLVPPPGVTTVTTQVFLRGDGAWVTTLSPSPPILATFYSGTTGIFTPSAGTLYMAIELCGGGGGGGGLAGGAAASGTTTSFGTESTSQTAFYVEAKGGGPGLTGFATVGKGGQGGIASKADVNITGAWGASGPCCGAGTVNPGGKGASGPFGDGGAGGQFDGTSIGNGKNAEPFCAGGGGTGTNGAAFSGGGGGAGGYLEHIITGAVSPSYAFTVGAGGRGGDTAVNGAGGAGGGGVLFIRMFFQ